MLNAEQMVQQRADALSAMRVDWDERGLGQAEPFSPYIDDDLSLKYLNGCQGVMRKRDEEVQIVIGDRRQELEAFGTVMALSQVEVMGVLREATMLNDNKGFACLNFLQAKVRGARPCPRYGGRAAIFAAPARRSQWPREAVRVPPPGRRTRVRVSQQGYTRCARFRCPRAHGVAIYGPEHPIKVDVENMPTNPR